MSTKLACILGSLIILSSIVLGLLLTNDPAEPQTTSSVDQTKVSSPVVINAPFTVKAVPQSIDKSSAVSAQPAVVTSTRGQRKTIKPIDFREAQDQADQLAACTFIVTLPDNREVAATSLERNCLILPRQDKPLPPNAQMRFRNMHPPGVGHHFTSIYSAQDHLIDLYENEFIHVVKVPDEFVQKLSKRKMPYDPARVFRAKSLTTIIESGRYQFAYAYTQDFKKLVPIPVGLIFPKLHQQVIQLPNWVGKLAQGSAVILPMGILCGIIDRDGESTRLITWQVLSELPYYQDKKVVATAQSNQRSSQSLQKSDTKRKQAKRSVPQEKIDPKRKIGKLLFCDQFLIGLNVTKDTLFLIDRQTLKLIKSTPLGQKCQDFKPSTDNSKIHVLLEHPNTLVVYDIPDLKEIQQKTLAYPIICYQPLPDSRMMISIDDARVGRKVLPEGLYVLASDGSSLTQITGSQVNHLRYDHNKHVVYAVDADLGGISIQTYSLPDGSLPCLYQQYITKVGLKEMRSQYNVSLSNDGKVLSVGPFLWETGHLQQNAFKTIRKPKQLKSPEIRYILDSRGLVLTEDGVMNFATSKIINNTPIDSWIDFLGPRLLAFDADANLFYLWNNDKNQLQTYKLDIQAR